MSITGTYAMRNGKVVKISDVVPGVGHATSDMCSPVKKPFLCHHLDDQPIMIHSRKQMAKELKTRNLIEKTERHGGGVDDKCHA